MDSNSTDQTPISPLAQSVNLLKELHQVLYRLFTWLLTAIALMTSESGKALFEANHSAMMGVVSTTCAYLLVWVAVTMLQRSMTDFFPIVIILLLQSVISVLALSFISFTISFIALALWLCVFGILIGFYKHQELYKLIPSKFKRLIERANPQRPPSPESDITQSPPSPEIVMSGSPRSQLSLESESLRSQQSPVSDGTQSPLPANNSPHSQPLSQSDNSELPPVSAPAKTLLVELGRQEVAVCVLL